MSHWSSRVVFLRDSSKRVVIWMDFSRLSWSGVSEGYVSAVRRDWERRKIFAQVWKSGLLVLESDMRRPRVMWS